MGSSSSSKQSPMSRLQKVCHCVAVLDIVFYFMTIIASVSVETAVTDRRPMKFEFNDNGTVIVEFVEQDELSAIWDYLDSAHYDSSVVYNAVYMSLIIIAATYLIVEVWLACVLIRGATEKSITHCKRWFWWRISIMLLTLIVSATDLYKMQYTLTLLLLIPLNIFRVVQLVLVLHLISEFHGGDNEKSLSRIP